MVVLKKTLESPLDCKEIKPVNPKVTQSWIFIGRTEHECKNWLIGKDPDAGRDWRQPTPVFLPRESHAQRSLEGYSPYGHEESDTTEVT